jgi:PPOX class probable F420-dependent enzyme
MADETAPAGAGINQRGQIKMTPEEVSAFLAETRPMTMCTMNHDGTIHAVAMWYGIVNGFVAIETKAKSQKARNLARNPMMTCLFEDGDSYDELRGVELVGTAEIINDPDTIWEVGVSVFSRYNGEYTEELRPFVEVMLNNRTIYKLNVDRTVSWDHRKLGLPAMKPTS